MLDPYLYLNRRRAEVHSTELHRQAELHRLATRERPDRNAEPPQQSTLHIANPVSGIGWIVRRVTSAIGVAKA